jgi:hypothetical protein
MKQIPLLALLFCLCVSTIAQPFTEKVYVHTDRSHYAPGDDLWYKAYLINAASQKLTNHSATLYAEFISPDAQIIYRQVLHVNEGAASGDFRLSDTLSSGRYRLRAYTAWMLNFDSIFLFQKEISIVNPLQKKAILGKTYTPSHPEIRFFPESGSLIENIPCTVAFKATDANGNGCQAKGSITDNEGKEVALFETFCLGMGKVTFSPQKGKTYVANGMAAGKPFSIELRKPLQEGFTMHAAVSDSAIQLRIEANRPAYETYADDEFVIETQCHGKKYISKAFELNDSIINLQIPTNIFPSGIVTLTLYDKLQRPHCERLVYVDQRNKSQISITPIVGKDSIEVQIAVVNAQQQHLQANLSLSVTDADIVPSAGSNIVSYLTLESEIRGNIEQPLSYFDTTNTRRHQQMDLLMLTQGWRNFIWKEKLDSIFRPRYNAEQGLVVRGQVKQLWGKKPYPNVNVSLMLMGAKGNGIGTQRTDSTGLYSFAPVEFYGSKRLILSAKNDKGKPVGEIKMDSLYLRRIYAPPVNPLFILQDTAAKNTSAQWDDFRLKYKKKYHLTDTFALKPVTVSGYAMDPLLRSWSFKIKKEDTVYNDYVSFLLYNAPCFTIFETSEYCPITYCTFYPCTNKMEYLAPKYTVNGKFIRNEDVYQISNLNLSDIESIDVYKIEKTCKCPISPLDSIVYGIYSELQVHMTTYKNISEKKDFQSINRKTNGYYQTRTFYPAKQNGEASSLKLLTLYWQPDIITNNKTVTIRFAAPKEPTKMRIVVEGIAEDMPLTGEVEYKKLRN